MQAALDRVDIAGIAYNATFLAAVFKHVRFQKGALTTGFLADEFPDGFHGAPLSASERQALIAAAVFAHLKSLRRDVTIGHAPDAARPFGDRWVVTESGDDIAAEVIEDVAEGVIVFQLAGEPVTVKSPWHPGERLFQGSVNDQEMAALIARNGAGWRLTARGAVREVVVRVPRVAELARRMPEKKAPDLSRFLLCPMPGLVVSVAVKEGDQIKAGQPLAVIEAMKMENVLRAERDGEIGEVRAKPGDTLAVDQVILEFA
jgi:propionyl-CoA carboxylase alpha chain